MPQLIVIETEREIEEVENIYLVANITEDVIGFCNEIREIQEVRGH